MIVSQLTPWGRNNTAGHERAPVSPRLRQNAEVKLKTAGYTELGCS